ncbi:MAG: 2-isopropylmalate synthase [Lentisphaerae bacterium]|nr:2-isopropylmalate synthase [Lentisphaerota bacterium]
MNASGQKKNKSAYVEILDTTLRDGEQTPGVAFTPAEKLQIAKALILRAKVDRVEIGSARVSEGERIGVRNILEWAEKHGVLERMEILGFIDGGKSANWVCDVGGKVINLLAKGSEKHCRIQLRSTPEAHYRKVAEEIELAHRLGLTVNVYLEDWSNGTRDDFGYVYNFIKMLQNLPVERIMLPDTLGVLTPDEVSCYMEWIFAAFPDLKVDFHGHNDYGMVTANSIAAIKAGVSGVHTTINGLGERTGNQPLPTLTVAVQDMTDRKIKIAEKQLLYVSSLVQTLSGKRCAWNTPVIGSDVFTQTCGVHADGDKKGDLYANKLLPERFSRNRIYALGKLSGKASLEKNLEEIGIELDDEQRKRVLAEIIRLGDKKKQVTAADLPFVIGSVLNQPISGKVQIVDYQIETRHGVTPHSVVAVKYENELIHGSANGDGGYDAFVKALRKALKGVGKTFPKLSDYEVRIPPGGKTDALVETRITWERENDRPLITVGVDSDQLAAAIQATEKMLNLVLV